MWCARCTKKNKCACSVKSIVSDYKDITIATRMKIRYRRKMKLWRS